MIFNLIKYLRCPKSKKKRKEKEHLDDLLGFFICHRKMKGSSRMLMEMGFFLGFKLQIPTLHLKNNWQDTVSWFFTLYFWSWNCPLHFSDNSLIEHLLCFSWGLMPGHWNKVEWDAVLYFNGFFPLFKPNHFK